MAINLTPAEQAAYDKATTDNPGGATLPDPVDIANGDATADDISFELPSGLQQDINMAQDSIDKSTADIIIFNDEISMNQAYVNHFHNFLRAYEEETKLTNGYYESSPWQLTEIDESNNVFHDVNTRYFPAGIETNPLELNSFPEETNSATKIFTSTNIRNAFISLESVVDSFTSTYTDQERIDGIPVGDDPPTGLQIIAFNNAQAAINANINAVLARITALLPFYDTPFTDDQNPTAPAAAAARKIELTDLETILIALNLNSTFPDSVLVDFQAIRASVVPDIDARIAEIVTFATPAFYGQRAGFAGELVDYSEGAIWKRLAAEASKAETITRKAKLQRKLDTYNGVVV